MPDIKLGKCEVCNVNDAIGVASTSMPYSCAFCAECAKRGADPTIVFVCLFDDVGTNFDKLAEGIADGMVSFQDGKYITYREWATTYKPDEVHA